MENEVTVFDNMSSGKMELIDHYFDHPNFVHIISDLLAEEIKAVCKNIDSVFHIAANPDVRRVVTYTKVHFDKNIAATYDLLESMRKNDIKYLGWKNKSERSFRKTVKALLGK